MRRGAAFSSLKLITALLLAALGAGLLIFSQPVTEGIRKGLTVCANVLIPSLFPFMVLSGFIALTEYSRILSAPFGWLARRVFKLPSELGVVVFLSLIGGYPVGAKTIHTLLEQGRISTATAQRMLCFCVNCGPSFLITAVGAGMLMNPAAGVVLFVTQSLATLLIGAVVSLGSRSEEAFAPQGRLMTPALGFVTAVMNAAQGMFAMCSFAVLFSGVLALLQAVGAAGWLAEIFPVTKEMAGALLAGLLEVTSGCVAASALGGDAGFLLISIFTSICGLSVIFQVISCFPAGTIRFGPFLLSRLFHSIVAAVMAFPLYKAFFRVLPASLNRIPPIMSTGSKTLLLALCLTAMCTILIFSLWGSLNWKMPPAKPKLFKGDLYVAFPSHWSKGDRRKRK
ncbi:hypothetical protein U6B65_08680 [Oscillospiraceae bacterium MB08-C2-2]|nr:hypothetical protein U6B65_08680 [Oscillospiraceae bacterium MB08-C2-2]